MVVAPVIVIAAIGFVVDTGFRSLDIVVGQRYGRIDAGRW
jgi:hypothetical protein